MSPLICIVLLALSQFGICAPITVTTTLSTIVDALDSPSPTQVAKTVLVQASAVPTGSSQSSVVTTQGSGGGVLNFLQSLFSSVSTPSAATSSGTSGTTGSATGSTWRSLLGSLFGSLGSTSGQDSLFSSAKVSAVQTTDSSDLAFILTTPTPVSQSSRTSSTPLQTSFTPLQTSSPQPQSSQTPDGGSSSSSASTGDMYDAISNAKDNIDKTFAKAILDSHNTYRAKHGVGALSWADGPYSYAKKIADSYDCSGVLTHTHGQYGENLAAGFPDGPSAVAAWYVEGETFDYSAYNEFNHFTQVVWKDTTQVGCAYKDCSAQGWQLYVVCEYSPVGNVVGQERANVLPLVS